MLSAAASPDGRYLAFMSERSLTGYDNRDAESGEPVEEVFRYDASEERLDCVSCNPSGASPEGKLSDPSRRRSPRSRHARRTGRSAGWRRSCRRPRKAHRRLESPSTAPASSSTTAASSSTRSTRWSRPTPTASGTSISTSRPGSATAPPPPKEPAIASSAGGCVSLISSGTAEEEADLHRRERIGRRRLLHSPRHGSRSPTKTSRLDVYDARVDGVPATLPVITNASAKPASRRPTRRMTRPPPAPPSTARATSPPKRCPQRQAQGDQGRLATLRGQEAQKHSKKAKRANTKRRAGR